MLHMLGAGLVVAAATWLLVAQIIPEDDPVAGSAPGVGASRTEW